MGVMNQHQESQFAKHTGAATKIGIGKNIVWNDSQVQSLLGKSTSKFPIPTLLKFSKAVVSMFSPPSLYKYAVSEGYVVVFFCLFGFSYAWTETVFR